MYAPPSRNTIGLGDRIINLCTSRRFMKKCIYIRRSKILSFKNIKNYFINLMCLSIRNGRPGPKLNIRINNLWNITISRRTAIYPEVYTRESGVFYQSKFCWIDAIFNQYGQTTISNGSTSDERQ